MTKITNGQDMVKAFEKRGFNRIRQKGSHIIMKKDEQRIVIPNHVELSKIVRLNLEKILSKNGD